MEASLDDSAREASDGLAQLGGADAGGEGGGGEGAGDVNGGAQQVGGDDRGGEDADPRGEDSEEDVGGFGGAGGGGAHAAAAVVAVDGHRRFDPAGRGLTPLAPVAAEVASWSVDVLDVLPTDGVAAVLDALHAPG